MNPSSPTTRRRAAAERVARPVPTLRVLFTGANRVQAAVHAVGGGLVVGRQTGERRGLDLPYDPLLSRRHFAIRNEDGALFVEDCGSVNGTRLNGSRVTRAALADGDVLRAGDSFLLLRLEPPEVEDGDVPLLLGESPGPRALRGSIALVAPTQARVLFLGESGVGKGAAAAAVHAASGREGPFVAVNCAAIPAELAESLLFGHRAGAFTGARGEGEGYFRAAHRGTLFLDEVGELSPVLQPKLLHALEAQEVVPVGATRAVPIDVRIVAATNADLSAELASRRFRGDLFARLSEIIVTIPSLRDRREDILTLIGPLVPPVPLDPDLVEALLLYGWPFNVRELGAVAAELRVRGVGRDRLDLRLVGARLRPEPVTPMEAGSSRAVRFEHGVEPMPERHAVEALLRAHGGVISEVARASGRSRRQVYRWLSRYAIDPEDFR